MKTERVSIPLLQNRDMWCSDNNYWSPSNFNITYSTIYKDQDRSFSGLLFFFNNRIQERTYSLWAHLWKNRADYLNPLFRADHCQTQGTLRLPTTPCNFMYKFWSGMYNRFEKGLQPRQSVTDYLMAVKEETQQLEEELEVLEEVRHTYSCSSYFLCFFLDNPCSMQASHDSGYVKCSHRAILCF